MTTYLLVRRVVLPVTCVQVKMSVLMRDLVPHGTLKGMVVDQRHG